jgi:hypothetical protein
VTDLNPYSRDTQQDAYDKCNKIKVLDFGLLPRILLIHKKELLLNGTETLFLRNKQEEIRKRCFEKKYKFD